MLKLNKQPCPWLLNIDYYRKIVMMMITHYQVNIIKVRQQKGPYGELSIGLQFDYV